MSKWLQKTAHIIGVPLDHGAGRRGVAMGPTAVRIAELHRQLERLGCTLRDHGDLQVSIPETTTSGGDNARYLPVVAEACTSLASHVKDVLDGNGFPLVIGGDHSIAIGTISGVAHHVKTAGDGKRLGVLWFDAHSDVNTPETSPSGNIHGMPMACLQGRGPRELCDIAFAGRKVTAENVVQIGLRDIDAREKVALREWGMHAFTMQDIDRRGIADVIREAIEIVSSRSDFLHVSFDIDVLDPDLAPGTGTPVVGGLTYREAHYALEAVAAECEIGSFELVEVNPILDVANKTARLAVGLIASALGDTIL